MIGGGTFTSQNKKLPGAYINFASAKNSSSGYGERGIAALALDLNWGEDGKIIEITAKNFVKNALKVFGYEYSDDNLKGIRDLFKNTEKAFLYRLNSGNKASCTYGQAKCSGTRGNDLKIVIAVNVDDNTKFDVSTYLGTKEVDSQTVSSAAGLVDNDFIVFTKTATLAVTAGTALTGGTNANATGTTYQNFLDLLESYQFNALGCLSTEASIINMYIAYTKRLRDTLGIKFQTVVYNTAADYEGVVNVKNTTTESNTGLIYWVTGAIAGCEINKSNTNKVYDGEFTINTNYTQEQLKTSIDDGEFILHKVGDEVRVLVDNNSLTTVTEEKNEVFKLNQTIRVIDQIAIDIATTFNTTYIGKVPNNESGRISLWNDITTLFREYQKSQAIENFEDSDVSVEAGENKKSVLVDVAVEIVGAMEKLYMTVVVE
ncbi:MAG: phage tail sheath family protein [Clostridia bacterium]|nr:phage tail sheath family protein [Clostridia bacterium]